MNLEELFHALERCEDTNSRTEKKRILRELSPEGVEAAKFYFDACLNPYKTFGIIPKRPDDFGEFPASPSMIQHLCQLLWDRKLTGGAAENEIELQLMNMYELHQKWIWRMFQRDPRIGVSYNTVAELWGPFIPVFEVQLATALKDLPAGKIPPAIYSVEPKYNGFRCAFFVSPDGSWQALSRNGKPFNNIEYIAAELVQATTQLGYDVVYDGELLADRWNETSSIVNTESEHPSRKTLRYHIFDMMTRAEWDQRRTGDFQERRLVLESAPILGKFAPVVPMVALSNMEDILDHASKFVAEGFEGAVIKRLDSAYAWDRGYSWIKIKFTETVDGKIIDYYKGSGKNAERLGGFVVLTPGGDKVNVGGGYSDEQRSFFWASRDVLLGRTLEFRQQKAKGIEIVSQFPIFIRIREDK